MKAVAIAVFRPSEDNAAAARTASGAGEPEAGRNCMGEMLLRSPQ
jgi:hypothetical protein